MEEAQPGFLKRLLRDPLTQFLAAGLLLFVLFAAFNGGPLGRDDKTIHVTDDALVVWLQYRKKAFSPDQALSFLKAMPADRRQELVDEYVREEALYRHAKSLGLDGNDAIIRQRLIQKMDYIALGLVGGNAAPTAAEMQAHFAENQHLYRQEGWVTLTHIFFADDNGKTRAGAARFALTTGIEEPKGDRFLYRRDYAEASRALINDHLGPAIAAAAFDAKTETDVWLGPLQSPHGWHLVQLKNRRAEIAPALEDVAAQVMHDTARAKEATQREKAVDAILSQYTIKVGP